MKKNVFSFLFCLNVLYLFSQVQTNIVRQKTFGGNLSDHFSKALVTSDNGYFVIVSSNSDISGDRTVSKKGLSDIWILKLNNDLTLDWQKSIGGSNYDYPKDILALDDGSYFLISGSNSPISLDKTIANYGLLDYWLIKIDSLGNILSQYTYGGENWNSPEKILKVGNSILIAGTSDSDSSGVKTENSRGLNDFWLIFVDYNGNIIKDKTLGGNYQDFFESVSYNETTSELFLCGITYSDISGDISNSAYGIADYLLFNFNPINDLLVSDFRYGGSSMSVNNITSICINNNKIYLGGNSDSDSSGVKTENSRDDGDWGGDYWVLKLNTTGLILWDKTIGGNYRENLLSLEFTSDNQLLLIGSSSSDVGWEKIEPRIGQQDFWIVSLDTSANILWQKTIGGTLQDEPKQVIVLGTNHYILFGDSKSGVSGHKTESCRGEEDVWIVEISTNLSIENFSENRLHLWPNPAEDKICIEFPNNSMNGLLYVFDTNGRIMLTKNINIQEPAVDIQFLAAGNYFVSLFDEKGKSYSAGFIKTK